MEEQRKVRGGGADAPDLSHSLVEKVRFWMPPPMNLAFTPGSTNSIINSPTLCLQGVTKTEAMRIFTAAVDELYRRKHGTLYITRERDLGGVVGWGGRGSCCAVSFGQEGGDVGTQGTQGGSFSGRRTVSHVCCWRCWCCV